MIVNRIFSFILHTSQSEFSAVLLFANAYALLSRRREILFFFYFSLTVRCTHETAKAARRRTERAYYSENNDNNNRHYNTTANYSCAIIRVGNNNMAIRCIGNCTVRRRRRFSASGEQPASDAPHYTVLLRDKLGRQRKRGGSMYAPRYTQGPWERVYMCIWKIRMDMSRICLQRFSTQLHPFHVAHRHIQTHFFAIMYYYVHECVAPACVYTVVI